MYIYIYIYITKAQMNRIVTKVESVTETEDDYLSSY